MRAKVKSLHPTNKTHGAPRDHAKKSSWSSRNAAEVAGVWSCEDVSRELAQQATGRRTDGRSTGKELGQPAAGIAPGAGGGPGQRLDRALRRHRSGPHRSLPQAAPASGEQRLRHLIPTATPHSLGGPRVSGPSAPTYLTAPLPQGPRAGPLGPAHTWPRAWNARRQT